MISRKQFNFGLTYYWHMHKKKTRAELRWRQQQQQQQLKNGQHHFSHDIIAPTWIFDTGWLYLSLKPHFKTLVSNLFLTLQYILSYYCFSITTIRYDDSRYSRNIFSADRSIDRCDEMDTLCNIYGLLVWYSLCALIVKLIETHASLQFN